jgi:predicted peptidase
MSANAQDTMLYKKEVFISGNDSLNYRILYPNNYDVNKKYPVVLFLHGKGERGSDNTSHLKHGSKFFADSANRAKYPAFVIFPQCPATDFWAKRSKDTVSVDSLGKFKFISTGEPNKSLGLVIKLIDSFSRTPQVNTKRIYVGGLSMGGMATFELLWRKPRFFAAAFPICGAGDPEKVKMYAKGFPLWVFHGDADTAVPVANSRLMVKRLRSSGAIVKYSEYAGVEHNSWDNAFQEPELAEWLFSHSL